MDIILMPIELEAIHALACPAADHCVLEMSRDGARLAWVLRHYRSETEPSIEGDIYVYDAELRNSNLYLVAAARIAPRIKADHEYWERGPMPAEWDEEAERARLQPV